MKLDQAKEEIKAPKPRFRYFCDACTGNAGQFSNFVEIVGTSIICSVCGKAQIAVKENFIPLK
jgi:hypothetical protein